MERESRQKTFSFRSPKPIDGNAYISEAHKMEKVEKDRRRTLQRVNDNCISKAMSEHDADRKKTEKKEEEKVSTSGKVLDEAPTTRHSRAFE